MNKQRVQIVIQGIQHNISDDIIKQKYNGYYSFRNNTHYITYDELPDSNDSSASATTLLKIKDSSVHMLKKGAITTRMEFDITKRHTTSYFTPYGAVQMEVATDELTTHREGKNFYIDIKYHLYLDGTPYSQCSISMEIIFN